MHIKKIIYQDRRDFTAIFECEHCEEIIQRSGYDDSNFHRNVIPTIPCETCGKASSLGYRPLETKYPESMQV